MYASIIRQTETKNKIKNQKRKQSRITRKLYEEKSKHGKILESRDTSDVKDSVHTKGSSGVRTAKTFITKQNNNGLCVFRYGREKCFWRFDNCHLQAFLSDPERAHLVPKLVGCVLDFKVTVRQSGEVRCKPGQKLSLADRAEDSVRTRAGQEDELEISQIDEYLLVPVIPSPQCS